MSLSKWIVRSSEPKADADKPSSHLADLDKSHASRKQIAESKATKSLGQTSRIPLWALNLDVKVKDASEASQTTSPAPTESVSSSSLSEKSLSSTSSKDRKAVVASSDIVIDLSSSPVKAGLSLNGDQDNAKSTSKVKTWPIFQSKVKGKEKKADALPLNSQIEIETKVDEISDDQPSAPKGANVDVKINSFFLSAKDKKKSMNESIESKFLEQIEESKRQQAAMFKMKGNSAETTSTTGLDFFGKVRMQMKDRKEAPPNKSFDMDDPYDAISETYDLSLVRQYGIPSILHKETDSRNKFMLEGRETRPSTDADSLSSHDSNSEHVLASIYVTNMANIAAEVELCDVKHPRLRESIEPGLHYPGSYISTLRELWTAWQCELSLEQAWSSQQSSLIDLTQETTMTSLPVDHRFNNSGSINCLAFTTIRQFMEVWAGKRRRAKKRKQQKLSSRRGSRRFQDEEDYEDTEFCNPLIILGSSGSGKTSAVYAAAEEVGFHVLEVSIPSVRNGSELLKRCSEAVQSHGLTVNESSMAMPAERDNAQPCNAMNLILLDEMDISFEADGEKKMSHAVLELVRSSKVPIVITCERWLKWFESFVLYDSTWMQRERDGGDLLQFLCDGDHRATNQSRQFIVDKLESHGEYFMRWLAQKHVAVAAFDTRFDVLQDLLKSYAQELPRLKSIPSLGYSAPYVQAIDSDDHGAKPGDVVRLFGQGFLQKDREAEGESAYPRIDVFVEGQPCDISNVTKDCLTTKLPLAIKNTIVRFEISLVLSSTHRLHGESNQVLRILPETPPPSIVESVTSNHCGRLKRGRSKNTTTSSVSSIENYCDNDSDFEDSGSERKVFGRTKKRIVVVDDDEQEDLNIPAAMDDCSITDAEVMVEEVDIEQSIDVKDELKHRSFSLPEISSNTSSIISLPIKQNLSDSERSLYRAHLQGELMAMEAMARISGSYSDADVITYTSFDSIDEGSGDRYGSPSMLQSSNQAALIIELSDAILKNSIHNVDDSSLITCQAMRQAFQDLQQPRQNPIDEQPSSNEDSHHQLEQEMVMQDEEGVESMTESYDDGGEAEISFDSDDEGSTGDAALPSLVGVEDASRRKENPVHISQYSSKSFPMKNYLTYQHQRQRVEGWIKEFCRYASSPCPLGCGVLAQANTIFNHAIRRCLVLDVLPILAQILVNEYEQHRIYGDLLISYRSRRRGPRSLIFHRMAAATGLSDAMLHRMMHLPFFGLDPVCCRSDKQSRKTYNN